MTRSGARTAVLGLAATALLMSCGAGAEDTPRTVLQAFDAADGHLRWSVELGAADGATEPVIVGDTVIVGKSGLPATA